MGGRRAWVLAALALSERRELREQVAELYEVRLPRVLRASMRRRLAATRLDRSGPATACRSCSSTRPGRALR